MAYPIYQVDAFTDRAFGGNPAAVMPLDAWLPDATLQSIAMENNLAETAFLVGSGDNYQLRWFTPAVEVDLCGHATLASAHVLFEQRLVETEVPSHLLEDFGTHVRVEVRRRRIPGGEVEEYEEEGDDPP